MIQQQIGVVTEMPQQSATISEFWATTVHQDEIAHSLPGITLGAPFWFRSARRHNVYPHLQIDERRAREVQRQWQTGDMIVARFWYFKNIMHS